MSTIPEIYAFNRNSDAGTDMFCPSVFVKGCSLRCPYCMNCQLVINNDMKPSDINEVLGFISQEKPKMIMISGGEPTMNMDNLFALIKLFSDHQCRVGISTNGVRDTSLYCVINRLAYVAMDLKGLPKTYDEISGSYFNGFFHMVQSWDLLRDRKRQFPSDFNYEIRTTVYPPYVNEESIRFLSLLFSKDEKWVIQPFRKTNNMLSPSAQLIEPYSELEIENLLKIARGLTLAKIEMRNV